MEILLRPLLVCDNIPLFAVISKTMREFDAPSEGTILGDPAARDMYSRYQVPRAAYHVAILDEKLVGGAGIAPLRGEDGSICELQRMFLLSEARGLGIGKKLMGKCLEDAERFRYLQCYLETLPEMKQAKGLYKKFGFEEISERLGDTGHHGCGEYMIRRIGMV